MKEQTKLSSGRQDGFIISARRLWPFGFILAGLVGTLIAFAYVWSL